MPDRVTIRPISAPEAIKGNSEKTLKHARMMEKGIRGQLEELDACVDDLATVLNSTDQPGRSLKQGASKRIYECLLLAIGRPATHQ